MRVLPLFLIASLASALPAAAGPVNIEDVRAMAFDKGVVKIEEVELSRRPERPRDRDEGRGCDRRIIKLERN